MMARGKQVVANGSNARAVEERCATSDKSMPRPMTTMAIAMPRMPSTDTLRSRGRRLSTPMKPGSMKAKTTNKAAAMPRTMCSWLKRKADAARAGKARASGNSPGLGRCSIWHRRCS